MQKSYSVLAEYYDKFTQNDCDYVRWSQYLYARLKGLGFKRGADVACGTGKMTKLLLGCGLDVVGLDSSEEMLTEARKNVRAVFVKQDMRKLQLPKKTQFVTLVNDGINYLAEEELLPFFQKVRENLVDGGAFFFDVSSVYKLKEVVGNNVFYYDSDQSTLLWCNELKPLGVEMTLTLFARRGESYLRSDERHFQHFHTAQSLCRALEQAGFEVVEISDDYGLGKPAENCLRIAFFAIKK